MRRTVYFIGLCLVLTIGLYGCGGTTTADSGQTAAQVKSAKVNFNVTFPPKSAVKSLVPQGTAYVNVYWSVYDNTLGSSAWGELTLYPDAATNTAKASAEMVPGFYVIGADCYDAGGNQLSSAYSYAQVGSGTNNIVITFVQGRWTFVNAAGVATPITLSGNESLNSFDLTSYWGGSDEYPLSWNLGNGTTLSSLLMYRSFSGDLSQLSLYASALGFPSNLPSGTSSIDALSSFYNFTNPAQSSGGAEAVGDRVIMFASVHPALMQGYGATAPASSPDMTSYFNTQIASGTKLTGTIIEYTVGAQSVPTDTGKTCTPSILSQMPAAVKLANKLSNRVSKSSLVGTVTETYTMCEYSASGTTGVPVFTEYQYTRTYTNVNVYPFSAVGADIPKGGIIVTTPAIASVTPSSGAVGATVTISGTNFDATAINNTVKFNGIQAAVSAATSTSITATVPTGATSGPITVTTANGTATSTSSFTVTTATTTSAPTITSFTPASGAVGTSVTITGTNFDAATFNNIVKLNGFQVSVTAATATSLTVTVPETATNGVFTVTTAGGTATSATNFTVTTTGGGGGGSGTAAAYFTKKAVGNSWPIAQTMTMNGAPYPAGTGTTTITVTAVSGAGVDLTTTSTIAATTTGRLEINAAGDLVYISGGVTMTYLPATFSVGTAYVMTPAVTGQGAANATIAALNVTRTVPAGTFTDCVQINYTKTDPTGVVTNATLYFSVSAGSVVEQIFTISGPGVSMVVTQQLQAGYVANP